MRAAVGAAQDGDDEIDRSHLKFPLRSVSNRSICPAVPAFRSRRLRLAVALLPRRMADAAAQQTRRMAGFGALWRFLPMLWPKGEAELKARVIAAVVLVLAGKAAVLRRCPSPTRR